MTVYHLTTYGVDGWNDEGTWVVYGAGISGIVILLQQMVKKCFRLACLLLIGFGSKTMQISAFFLLPQPRTTASPSDPTTFLAIITPPVHPVTTTMSWNCTTRPGELCPFSTTGSPAVSVMTAGTTKMPTWLAERWDSCTGSPTTTTACGMQNTRQISCGLPNSIARKWTRTEV